MLLTKIYGLSISRVILAMYSMSKVFGVIGSAVYIRMTLV